MNKLEKYFDYAATCPMTKPILDKLYKNYWGNSSSLHSWGHKAKIELEKARQDIMKILNIDSKIGKIYFTSGGSESDNIALSGTQLLKHQYKLTSQIEHDAIYRNLNSDILPHIKTNRNGMVDLKDIRNKINEDKENRIGLISVMAINNETGVIQPIEEIYDLCKEKNIIFHTDAVQAIGKMDIDFNKVDILSGSAHKFYGPKGIGFIYIKNDIFNQIKPIIYGGGHENGISNGTVNVPGIMAMRDALIYTMDEKEEDINKYKKFKDIILNILEEYIQINGDLENSIPHILNISFSMIDGEELITFLDMEGFAVSTGSACSSNHSDKQSEISHVLKAMGLLKQRARNSIRISFGVYNTEESVHDLAKLIKKYIT